MAFSGHFRSPFLTCLTQEASSERARTIPLAYSLELRQLIAALLRLDVSVRCRRDGVVLLNAVAKNQDVAVKGVKAYSES